MTDQGFPVHVEPWFTRARAVQEQHGVITPQHLVSAADLAAIKHTRNLFGTLMVLFADSIPSGLADEMMQVVSALVWQEIELDSPETNWTDHEGQ